MFRFSWLTSSRPSGNRLDHSACLVRTVWLFDQGLQAARVAGLGTDDGSTERFFTDFLRKGRGGEPGANRATAGILLWRRNKKKVTGSSCHLLFQLGPEGTFILHTSTFYHVDKVLINVSLCYDPRTLDALILLLWPVFILKM